MGKDSFNFKRFEIKQDRCAMKVGTDGVLLGAWADTDGAVRIADVGTGTGLVAVMLAQKCEGSGASVLGIEIDADAALQASENMKSTPWAENLSAVCADVRDFKGETFDLVVSNPPFFVEDVKCGCSKRNAARHTDGLGFGDLLDAVSGMLLPEGRFCVILPFDSAPDFIGLAVARSLYLSKKTLVVTKPGARPKRVLMEFIKGNSSVSACHDTLLLTENGERTEAYLQLTGDYYLDKP